MTVQIQMSVYEHIQLHGDNLAVLATRLKQAIDPAQGFVDLDTCIDIAEALSRIGLNAGLDVAPMPIDTPADLTMIGAKVEDAHQIRMAFSLSNGCIPELLLQFINQPGQPLTAEVLSSSLGINQNSLKVYMCQLRKELRENNFENAITTVRNGGYFMSAHVASQIIRKIHAVSEQRKLDNSSDETEVPVAAPTRCRSKLILKSLVQSPNSMCTYEFLKDELGISKTLAAVYVSMLRKELRAAGLGVKIQNSTGVGYYLSHGDRDIVRNYIKNSL